MENSHGKNEVGLLENPTCRSVFLCVCTLMYSEQLSFIWWWKRSGLDPFKKLHSTLPKALFCFVFLMNCRIFTCILTLLAVWCRRANCPLKFINIVATNISRQLARAFAYSSLSSEIIHLQNSWGLSFFRVTVMLDKLKVGGDISC